MLQPWTPCLPIRGGKLHSSKDFSTSNPQLSFICTSNSLANNKVNNTSSTNSLNSSFIWREATPNNFNLYSTSVSSLNAVPTALPSNYRHSVDTNRFDEWSSVSEEKSLGKKSSRHKAMPSYENACMIPLLPRRRNEQVRIVKSSQPSIYSSNIAKRCSSSNDASKGVDMTPYVLYDRRTNRSFEAPSRDTTAIATSGHLRRSTPHLVNDDDNDKNNAHSNRHSTTWCCGNFMMKQWKKINNYD